MKTRNSGSKFIQDISFIIIFLLLLLTGRSLSQSIDQQLNNLLKIENTDSSQQTIPPTQQDSTVADSAEFKKKAVTADSTAGDIEVKMDEGQEMVHVPAGNFIMGSEEFDIDEGPQREVFLEEYWIDKYPVTNRQYARFLNSYLERYPGKRFEISKFINIHHHDSRIYYADERYGVVEKFEDHPVVHITWYGANEYCKFYHKRLPTEAEWEKAARGTDGRLYPWGNEIDSSRANYWDSKDPFDDETTPVGFYNGQNYQGFQTSDSPGPYGTYDMVGNVREWVADWYQWNYYAKSSKINPPGPSTGIKKVVRGGGYLFHPRDLRTTLRYALKPNESSNFIGFRCARSTKPEVR